MTIAPRTWPELEALADDSSDRMNPDRANSDRINLERDRTHGPTNAQATLRLFGQAEADVRVTLYRDNHAWCPYCQKVWLWLEEQRIPYRIRKVTMFCYGEKERWYKQLVPSGMLPALELDGQFITESDDILLVLERAFGPLYKGMEDASVLPLRRLERSLFSVWCNWLCRPSGPFGSKDPGKRDQFQAVVNLVEAALASTPGPYFLESFSTADVVFTPYVERMNASLYYYKGYSLRETNPGFSAWFDALESRPTYRGTQSDFHTHAHDLPPQMGGCYGNDEPQAQDNQRRVDQGPWMGLPDVGYPEPETSRTEALQRVLRHRVNIIRVNPAEDSVIDAALRCALTRMITGEVCVPPPGADGALRYLRDRINVPRDMSIYAAKRLRQALEETAALAGDPSELGRANRSGPPIPVNHRRDQNPLDFAHT